MATQRGGSSRPRRSQEDLAAAAQQVCYELRALVGNHGRRASDNAYLEASLLHARNLIEFLIGPSSRRRKTDIAPDDFAIGWEPQPAFAVNRLLGHLDEIDKHVAHLTWERVDWIKVPCASYWDYPELADDALEVFAAFAHFAKVRDASVSDCFLQAVDIARRKLDEPAR